MEHHPVGVDQEVVLGTGDARREVGEDQVVPAVVGDEAIAGGEVGIINMATLTVVGDQTEVIYSIQRVANDGTLDTHTGDFNLVRLEFHYMVSGKMESIGE